MISLEDGMANLILDSGTKRLLELASSSEPNLSDEDVHTILSIVNTVAPKLLDGLTEGSCNRIARGLEVRCYPRDEVLFRQGDPPDAYYTVVRGAVSIYAISGDSSTPCIDDEGGGCSDEGREGNILCQLPPGSSFGELSFNENGIHSPRNAGVVSDGSHGQSRVMVRIDGSRFSGGKTTGGEATTGGLVEVEASEVAVLLCIPEALYMKELFPRHAAKHSTKEKLDFLRSSFLFQHWTGDQLIKLAYAMKTKTYAEGTVIANEGEHIEFVHMIRKGRVTVRSAVKGGNKNSVGSKRPLGSAEGDNDKKIPSPSETPRNVDIAILGDGDVVGLVEAATRSKKMRRTIVATKCTDTFVVPIYKFLHILTNQDKTKDLIQKMADKRKHWESLRLDYAAKFPTMPRNLPKDWEQMSLYILHPDSVLTEAERRQQNENQTLVSCKLREARAFYRVATTESYYVKSAEELARAEALCQEAREGASEAFRCEKKRSSFLKEVAGIEQMIRGTSR